MRLTVSAVLMWLLAAGLLGMDSKGAWAETPTPTLAPAATATAAPTAEGESAEFMGSFWVDGRPGNEAIEARIGDVVCGETTPVLAPGAYVPVYDIEVVSDEVVPGCGTPGAIITFFIGGKKASQTAEWYPTGESYEHLDLVVGPPFAQFSGTFSLKSMPVEERVIPFIGDVACGYQLNPWMGEGPTYGYHVVVYSEELKAGCGTDGAEVTFKLVKQSTGEVVSVAMGSARWRAMAFEKDVNLVFPEAPIEEVPVAGGGSGGGGASGWWGAIVVALVVMGGGALAGARALRRR